METNFGNGKANHKIGCALGGGGARGLAHIGVLKVLEEYGVYPEIITGTSMGAIIGALYASGLRATDIEHLVLGMDWKHFRRLADPTLSLTGLIEGKRITALLESVLGNRNFDSLNRKFACLAADIKNGEQVVLRDGSLVEAVRASISLPGVLVPVRHGKRYLVDGGLVNQVPVDVCREMGAAYVIAVNVIPDPAKMPMSQEKEPVKTPEVKAPAWDFPDDAVLTPTDLYNVGLTAKREDIEKAVKKFFQQPQRSKEELALIQKSHKKAAVPDVPKAPSLIDVLVQTFTITGYRIAVENMKAADLRVSPAVETVGFWQFDRAADLILAGELAARHTLDGDKRVLFHTYEPKIDID